jgi:hypothetical protein
VNVAFEIDPNPPGVGPSQLVVKLSDASGAPVDGATVEVEGNMSHAGMQPLRARFRAGEAGTYEAPFSWTMAGDWTLTVTATLPGGQVAERQFNVTVEEGMSHKHEEEHAEEHATTERIPNDGAVIRLVSPEDGAVFNQEDEIKVEIEYEDFELGEDNNHWHIYVDGASPRMIMGKMTEAVLRDLESGQHEISVYLSVGTHEDLEDGAAVTISVLEGTSN